MKTKINKQNRTDSTIKSAKKGSQKDPGLLNRTEQLSETETATATATAAATTTAPAQPIATPLGNGRPARAYVNYAEREFNRTLPAHKVLTVIRRWMPALYERAEIVGTWVWITFPEPPTEHTRADLSQLGFHWNNTRKCWQHPCGATLPRGTQEPREKYTSYFPSDEIA